ncbi:hypothetical protein [Pseudoalteromonas ruthenica]|uniref:hypothetical protein n=1 Tax=Pseudoalteromonas ruthenica TaxID=151081 RepID=UPI00110AC4FD|nr:hypothetical protein [Pseudoalteromonas ruthenica]TMP23799.1 hypothetical protein CWC06_09610 [Pseudoalteromonas ruthenica]
MFGRFRVHWQAFHADAEFKEVFAIDEKAAPADIDKDQYCVVHKVERMPSGFDDCRLLKSSFDEHCGCKEEEWETPVGYAFIHLKPDGTGDVFFENGDAGEWEIDIHGAGEQDFRRKFLEYIDSLLVEE